MLLYVMMLGLNRRLLVPSLSLAWLVHAALMPFQPSHSVAYPKSYVTYCFSINLYQHRYGVATNVRMGEFNLSESINHDVPSSLISTRTDHLPGAPRQSKLRRIHLRFLGANQGFHILFLP